MSVIGEKTEKNPGNLVTKRVIIIKLKIIIYINNIIRLISLI